LGHGKRILDNPGLRGDARCGGWPEPPAAADPVPWRLVSTRAAAA